MPTVGIHNISQQTHFPISCDTLPSNEKRLPSYSECLYCQRKIQRLACFMVIML